MLTDKLPVFDRMTALADGVRSRILLLLEEHELTVSEIRTVTQLPQSTVSRHLKILSDGEWLVSRANGTNRFYSFPAGRRDGGELGRLWALIREQVAGTPAAARDVQRLQPVLAARRAKSRAFFSSSAGDWDRLRDELFGEGFLRLGLLGLLDDRWTVADLGCGTGRIAEALAPFVRRVIAVDGSSEMLDAARERLGGLAHCELRQGELEQLPLEDESADAATLVLVLHHLPHPGRAVREVARVLRPGGRLLLVDMLPHERAEYQREMGHVWLGFEPDRIRELAGDAGFEPGAFITLPADPTARGPLLFAASFRKDGAPDNDVPQPTDIEGDHR